MLSPKESEEFLNWSHYLQNSYFVHNYLQSEEEPKKIESFAPSDLLKGFHKHFIVFSLQQSNE